MKRPCGGGPGEGRPGGEEGRGTQANIFQAKFVQPEGVITITVMWELY